ncbi:MAG: protein-L-isoaspartate O-methyltransferase [Candidatus Heimdallarchaeota archaeon]|nr:MAG: protein-L-isoaspartate O-methyltransferase [Candidatus Heimdallarchaeota archaeon]
MFGWIIPPPKPSKKTKETFYHERQLKVAFLKQKGYLKSRIIEKAMLKIPREHFVPCSYRDHTYEELPFPLPGKNSTISCPHSYPMFYEAIALSSGDNFLEIGLGSGYGAILAAEIVGPKGKVTSIEIDHDTFLYAQERISKFEYPNLFLIEGDGGKGYYPHAPYDKICLTAACVEIPPPLIDQLDEGGKLITPRSSSRASQDLVLLEKEIGGNIKVITIEKVLYVSLQGEYGC